MPAGVVKGIAKEVGISPARAEYLWKRAKKRVGIQYPNLSKGSDSYYAATMGIFKRMSGYQQESSGMKEKLILECLSRVNFFIEDSKDLV